MRARERLKRLGCGRARLTTITYRSASGERPSPAVPILYAVQRKARRRCGTRPSRATTERGRAERESRISSHYAVTTVRHSNYNYRPAARSPRPYCITGAPRHARAPISKFFSPSLPAAVVAAAAAAVSGGKGKKSEQGASECGSPGEAAARVLFRGDRGAAEPATFAHKEKSRDTRRLGCR